MRFDTYKLCGAAILCALAVFLLRHIKKEFEVPLTIAGSLLLTVAAFGMGKPIFEYISDLMSASSIVGEATGILVKVIGIAIITRISADVCREMGASNVASSLETVAKFEIILLSLPLVSSVLESVQALFSEAGF
jgi:stage III sporulation protein AD